MLIQKYNYRGFTILELIIVVVIVGVLLSLAIPKFVKVVERARGTEGIAMLSMIRGGMDRCYLMTRSYSACIQKVWTGSDWDFSPLGIDDPTKSPNSHFSMMGMAAVVLPPTQRYSFVLARNDHELLIPDPGTLIMIVCPSGDGVGMAPGKSQIALCVTDTTIKIIGSGFYEGI